MTVSRTPNSNSATDRMHAQLDALKDKRERQRENTARRSKAATEAAERQQTAKEDSAIGMAKTAGNSISNFSETAGKFAGRSANSSSAAQATVTGAADVASSASSATTTATSVASTTSTAATSATSAATTVADAAQAATSTASAAPGIGTAIALVGAAVQVGATVAEVAVKAKRGKTGEAVNAAISGTTNTVNGYQTTKKNFDQGVEQGQQDRTETLDRLNASITTLETKRNSGETLTARETERLESLIARRDEMTA